MNIKCLVRIYFKRDSSYRYNTSYKDAEPTPDRQEDEGFENLWLTAEEAMSQLTHNQSKELLQKALEILEQPL